MDGHTSRGGAAGVAAAASGAVTHDELSSLRKAGASTLYESHYADVMTQAEEEERRHAATMKSHAIMFGDGAAQDMLQWAGAGAAAAHETSAEGDPYEDALTAQSTLGKGPVSAHVNSSFYYGSSSSLSAANQAARLSGSSGSGFGGRADDGDDSGTPPPMAAMRSVLPGAPGVAVAHKLPPPSLPSVQAHDGADTGHELDPHEEFAHHVSADAAAAHRERKKAEEVETLAQLTERLGVSGGGGGGGDAPSMPQRPSDLSTRRDSDDEGGGEEDEEYGFSAYGQSLRAGRTAGHTRSSRASSGTSAASTPSPGGSPALRGRGRGGGRRGGRGGGRAGPPPVDVDESSLLPSSPSPVGGASPALSASSSRAARLARIRERARAEEAKAGTHRRGGYGDKYELPDLAGDEKPEAEEEEVDANDVIHFYEQVNDIEKHLKDHADPVVTLTTNMVLYDLNPILGIDAGDYGEMTNWNMFYQRKVSRPAPPEAGEQLLALLDNYHTQGERVACEIVRELAEPEYRRRYKPVPIHGQIHHNVFVDDGIAYRVVADLTGFYGSLDAAMRAASNELRAQQALMNLCDGISFAPMMVVDYLGYRVVVTPLMPLGRSTLFYGSWDCHHFSTGATRIQRALRDACDTLNIKGHLVGKNKGWAKHIDGPGDIQGHVGDDGRCYIVKTRRLFPPQPPPEGDHHAHLHRVLRPEFCRAYERALCSDAFTRFALDGEIKTHNQEVRDAYTHLITQVVPLFARELSTQFAHSTLLAAFQKANLSERMHQRGINMRLLGLVRVYASCAAVKQLVLVEMLARVIKVKLRERLRALEAGATPASVVCTLLNIVFGDNRGAARFWGVSVRRDVQAKFTDALTEEERLEEVDLRAGYVSMYLLLLRVMEINGLAFVKGLFVTEESSQLLFAQEMPFRDGDFVELRPRVRTSVNINMDDVHTLIDRATSSETGTPDDAGRLLQLAAQLCKSAKYADTVNAARYDEELVAVYTAWALVLLRYASTPGTPVKLCVQYCNRAQEIATAGLDVRVASPELWRAWGRVLLHLGELDNTVFEVQTDYDKLGQQHIKVADWIDAHPECRKASHFGFLHRKVGTLFRWSRNWVELREGRMYMYSWLQDDKPKRELFIGPEILVQSRVNARSNQLSKLFLGKNKHRITLHGDDGSMWDFRAENAAHYAQWTRAIEDAQSEFAHTEALRNATRPKWKFHHDEYRIYIEYPEEFVIKETGDALEDVVAVFEGPWSSGLETPVQHVIVFSAASVAVPGSLLQYRANLRYHHQVAGHELVTDLESRSPSLHLPIAIVSYVIEEEVQHPTTGLLVVAPVQTTEFHLLRPDGDMIYLITYRSHREHHYHYMEAARSMLDTFRFFLSEEHEQLFVEEQSHNTEVAIVNAFLGKKFVPRSKQLGSHHKHNLTHHH